MKRIVYFLLIVNMGQCQTLPPDPGFDFANFNTTPIHALAEAVQNQDTGKISYFIIHDKMGVNYQEPKFGLPLLTLAILNNKANSTLKLIYLGANPNIRSPKDNSTPLLCVCEFPSHIDNVLAALTLLIKYGANVNYEQVEELQNSAGVKFTSKMTALKYICDFGTVEWIKLLIDNGAKLDIYPRNGEESILTEATLNSRLDILKYLLIDKKVQIPEYCVIRQEGTSNERKLGLRELVLDRKELMDAHQQDLKKQILEFLKLNRK